MTKRPICQFLCAAALVVALVSSETFGQTSIRVETVATPLVRGAGNSFMQPRWSPDGSRIAFTGDAYRGIWIADSEGKDIQQISDDRAAGFGLAWSPDGTKIVARVARYEGRRRSDALKLFDVDEPSQRLLTSYRADMPTLPAWSGDGSHVVLAAKSGVEVVAADPASAKTVAPDPVPVIRDGRVSLVRPAQQTVAEVAGVPAGHPINLVPSPDGRLVAFEIVGGNLIVGSIEGASVIDLGRGHRPQWSPDGEWVVFMKTEDDGHVITASDLWAARVDGFETVRLTDTHDALEMNPSWSPDGSRIAFDDRGAIYQIQVTYER